jgi:dihydrolipoamide dehydrogenase
LNIEAFDLNSGKPNVSLEKLRAHKEKVIGKLTGGFSQMDKMRTVVTVRILSIMSGRSSVMSQKNYGVERDRPGPWSTRCNWKLRRSSVVAASGERPR